MAGDCEYGIGGMMIGGQMIIENMDSGKNWRHWMEGD